MKTNFRITVSKWLPLLILFFISQFAVAAQLLPEIKQARGYVEADQKQKAIALLKQTADNNPTDASVWYYLGLAQIANGNKLEAAQSFQTGLQKNEKEPLNLVGKGYIHLLNNQMGEARNFFLT